MSWLPIETAPKDGTVIDMWTRAGNRCVNVRWVFEPREGVAHASCIMDGWKHPGDEPWGCLTEDQFTHWQPLPTPPSTEGGEV